MTTDQLTDRNREIIAEHQVLHERTLALYNGVGIALGWKVEVTEQDRSWYGPIYRYKLLNGVTGQAISLDVRDKKVVVVGYWPTYVDTLGNTQWSSPRSVNEDSPSIRVSPERGYHVIAREIERRFLPDYNRIWNKLVARNAEQLDYKIREKANWGKLLEAGGSILKARSTSDVAGSLSLKNGYGEVRMESADSVKIEFRSVPVSLAEKILSFIDGEREAHE